MRRPNDHLASDDWLMRLDADTGEVIWIQEGEHYARFALDPEGNIFVLGMTELTKLDPNGQLLWSQPRAHKLSYGERTLTVDSKGNVLLATVALTESTSKIDGDPVGFFELEKLDAEGNSLWSHRFGDGTSLVVGAYVATDANDNVVFHASEVEGSVDFGGGPLTGKYVLAKYDPNGNHLFSEALGPIAQIYYRASSPVQTDAAGNIFVATPSYERIDVGLGEYWCGYEYILKFDPTGKPVRQSCAYADELTVLPDGSFITSWNVGHQDSETIGEKECIVFDPNDAGQEGVLARYDALGSWLATSCATDPGYQSFGQLAPDPSGMFFMTAAFGYGGQLTLPDGTIVPAFDQDWTAVIAKVGLTP